MLALVVTAAFATVPAWTYLQSRDLGASLGGSLSVRKIELAHAVIFLSQAPWRWLTGVGAVTRDGAFSLGDIVGAQTFYLADLGWLGVVFEYGLIGAVLILAVHLLGLRMAQKAGRTGDPTAQALFDYIVYILLVSPIYSVVFAPGELAACMAMAFFYSRPERLKA